MPVPPPVRHEAGEHAAHPVLPQRVGQTVPRAAVPGTRVKVDTCSVHVPSPGVPGLRLQPDLDELHGAGDGELHGAARHTRQVHAGQVVGGQLGRQVLIMTFPLHCIAIVRLKPQNRYPVVHLASTATVPATKLYLCCKNIYTMKVDKL